MGNGSDDFSAVFIIYGRRVPENCSNLSAFVPDRDLDCIPALAREGPLDVGKRFGTGFVGKENVERLSQNISCKVAGQPLKGVIEPCDAKVRVPDNYRRI